MGVINEKIVVSDGFSASLDKFCGKLKDSGKYLSKFQTSLMMTQRRIQYLPFNIRHSRFGNDVARSYDKYLGIAKKNSKKVYTELQMTQRRIQYLPFNIRHSKFGNDVNKSYQAYLGIAKRNSKKIYTELQLTQRRIQYLPFNIRHSKFGNDLAKAISPYAQQANRIGLGISSRAWEARSRIGSSVGNGLHRAKLGVSSRVWEAQTRASSLKKAALGNIDVGLSKVRVNFAKKFAVSAFDFVDKTITKLGEKINELKDKIVEGIAKAVDDLKEKVSSVTDKWNSAKSAFENYFNTSVMKIKQQGDVLGAIYGKGAAGKSMSSYMNRAQEEGWKIGDYVEVAAKANRLGMGEKDVDNFLMKLGGRFAMINGQSIGDVAQTMMSAVEGGDVGGLAQLMGGGQGLQNKMERAGLGRALKRGDLDYAYKLINQFADAYGYTEEAAEAMANTLQGKVGITISKVENIFTRIGIETSRVIEPALMNIVDIVNNIVDSEIFTHYADYAVIAIRWVGKALEFITGFVKKIIVDVITIVDKISSVSAAIKTAFLGVSMYLKSMGLVKMLTLAFGIIKKALPYVRKFLIGPIKTALVAVGRVLMNNPILKKLLGRTITNALAGVAKFIAGPLKFAIVALGKLLLRHPLILIGTIVSTALEMITNAFGDFYDAETGRSTTFIQRFVGGFFYLSGCLNAVIENWINEMFGGIDALHEAFSNFIGDIYDSFMETLNEVLKVVNEIAGTDFDTTITKYERYVAPKQVPKTVDGHKRGMQFAAEGIALVDSMSEGFDNLISEMKLEHKENKETMNGIGRDTGKIRGMMTEEQEVAWLKELSERQYINRFNVQSPQNTFNMSITNNKPTRPEDTAAYMDKYLKEQAAVSGYGNVKIVQSA